MASSTPIRTYNASTAVDQTPQYAPGCHPYRDRGAGLITKCDGKSVVAIAPEGDCFVRQDRSAGLIRVCKPKSSVN